MVDSTKLSKIGFRLFIMFYFVRVGHVIVCFTFLNARILLILSISIFVFEVFLKQ